MNLSEQYNEIIGWNEGDDHTNHVRNEVIKLEAENKALKERIEKTAERARLFASDEVDVGMDHQIGRWMGIADAHEETLALLIEEEQSNVR